MFEAITDSTKKAAVTAEYSKVMNEYKQTQIFPNKNIPGDFLNIVRMCFRFVCPDALQMTWDAFKGIISNYECEYTFLDMGTILYVMQKRTMAELDMTIAQYQEFNELLEVLMLEWKTLLENEAIATGKRMEDKALKELEGAIKEQEIFNAAMEKAKEELGEHITIPLGKLAEA